MAIGANVKTRLAVSLVSLMLAIPCQAKIIYVDDDANGLNDGSSWQNAYKFLQDALMMAEYGDELRVAQGDYKPDLFVLSDRPNLGRAETFQLKNGVFLKGGYAGFGEPDPNARNIELYETILSGDLQSNDIKLTNPADMRLETSRLDNSDHVITGSGTDETAIIDGFTITAGRNSGLGAGIYNRDGNPRLINCTFNWNYAEWGGGMGNWNSSPTVINCKFYMNAAQGGGGIDNVKNSTSILINCTVSSNVGFWRGGGILNGYAGVSGSSNPILINCILSGNSTDRYGGGMYNEFSSPKIINCTFNDNSAERGGAIYSYRDSSPVLTNCILYGDRSKAIVGNEIYLGSYGSQSSSINVSYSNVQGGQGGVYVEAGSTLNWENGNINSVPFFADPNNGDYHLKSQAGRWDANEGRWTKDEVTSLCIDAGDPASPIGFEPFPNGGIINMGAYGGTEETSKSYFGEPVCETIVAGDINGDCVVNLKDFAIMAFHWLESAPTVNSNAIVDLGIEYYIQTNKAVYRLGENVEMLFRVTNLRDEDVLIGCSQSPEFNIWIQKDGETIWMKVHGWYQFSPGIYLSRAESKKISYSWDMRDDTGNLIEAGIYDVVGVMYNEPWNYVNHGSPTITEVAVPITIILCPYRLPLAGR